MDANDFSSVIADGIRGLLVAAGESDMPVFAEVEEAHLDGNCVRVVTESLEEVIPGNHTYCQRGRVETRVGATWGANAAARRALLAKVQGIVRAWFDGVNDGWEPNGTGHAPLVLQLFGGMGADSVESPYYVWAYEWRAYLQF